MARSTPIRSDTISPLGQSTKGAIISNLGLLVIPLRMTNRPTSEEERRRRGEKRFWSRIATRYDAWVDGSFSGQYAAFKSCVLRLIEADDKVLEVGTGTGSIALAIGETGPEVMGIDISPEMVAVAMDKLKAAAGANVRFQVSDAYSLPFEDGTFDKVVAVNALQTMKEPQRAVSESLRVLKDGGEAICITYCFGTSGAWEIIKLARWVVRYGLPKYWRNFKCEQVRELFAQAGYDVIGTERVWERPAAVLVHARKPTGAIGPSE
jgi:ubiquinone/menaquinone biosynthesis C-methylase UbiE